MSQDSQIRDAILRHEAALSRVANHLIREFMARLAELEPKLYREIRRRFGWIAERGPLASDFTAARLKQNLEELRRLLRGDYGVAGRELQASLKTLLAHEAKFAGEVLVRYGAGKILGLDPDLVMEILAKRPFQGGVLRSWIRRLSADTAWRVERAILDGLHKGQGIDAIVRALRGTRAGHYLDGILETSRRDAATIVRSAVAHVSNTARDEIWSANEDLLAAVRWLGTLDSRTCKVCAIRDGLKYTVVDHEPIGHSVEWEDGPGRMHPNDRCTSVPELKGEKLTGQRAAKGGPVRATMTYLDWLKTQPASVQLEVLGPRRYKLFKSGTALRGLFDSEGEYLTIDQLIKRGA